MSDKDVAMLCQQVIVLRDPTRELLRDFNEMDIDAAIDEAGNLVAEDDGSLDVTEDGLDWLKERSLFKELVIVRQLYAQTHLDCLSDDELREQYDEDRNT